MAKTERLKGSDVLLEPFSDRYLTEDYVGWLNDPSVMRYSEQRHRHHSLETCKAFVASFDASPNQLWAIVRADTGEHIGNITAMHDVNNCLADIGILIGAKGVQGKGYGRDAWRTVLDYLAARPDIFKVTGGCMTANSAMVRIMESCNMVKDGYRTAHYLLDGYPVDLVYYYIKSGNPHRDDLMPDRT